MLTLLLVLAAVGAAVALVFLRSPEYRIERSIQVYAFRSEIFGLLNDLHRWADWSPWETLDPSRLRSFSGPASGIGSSYAWSGKGRVGEGRMTIIESRPDEVVGITIEFFRPFKAICSMELSLRADSGATRVTWTMTGTNTMAAKLFSLVSDMEKAIGRDFERGLSTLKTVCEAKSLQPVLPPVIVDELFVTPRPEEPEVETVDPTAHAK
jgi:hypothetical protein